MILLMTFSLQCVRSVRKICSYMCFCAQWNICGKDVVTLSLIPAALADILQGLFQVLHNDHCKCESSKEMLRKIEGIQ